MKRNGPTRKEILQYYFNMLLKTGTVFKILVLFLVSSLFILLLGLVLTFISADSIRWELWNTLLHLLDPGVLSGDQASGGYLLIMLIATLGGMVLFGTLIGIINDGITRSLSRLNSEHYKIISKGHILIIGFNDEIYGILRELIALNQENRKNGGTVRSIVVLDDTHSSEEMEELAEAMIGRHRGTHITYRRGSSFNPESILLCGAENAKGIIVNAQSDAQTIRWVLAVSNVLGKESDTAVTAVIKELKNITAAEYAGGEKLRVLFLDDVVNRIIAQSCRCAGISKAFEDLLDFKGIQFVLYADPRFTGMTLPEINLCFENATVVGKQTSSEECVLTPSSDQTVGEGERVLFIADNSDVIQGELRAFPSTPPAPPEVPAATDADLVRQPVTILILRFSRMIEMLVEESFSYLPAGSKIYVACDAKYSRFLKLLEFGYQEQGLEIVHLKDISYYSIESLLDRCQPDKCVILSDYMEPSILSEDGETVFKDIEKEDEEVMLTILLLRDIAARKGLSIDITAEVQSISVKDLTDRMEGISDCVNAGHLTSHILTQTVQDPHLSGVFKSLLSANGALITAYPASAFFPLEDGRSYDIRSVSARLCAEGKTLIGVRKAGEALRLNPCKTQRQHFAPEDLLIVIEGRP